MKRILLLFAVALPAPGAVCPSGYSYYKALTVQAGKVSGTQTNFRALILNPTASSHQLATVANGGRVTSANGYDIVPATAGGTQLPFEVLGYTASNGNLQMWVDVSSIADGSVINLCYGNVGITTYQGNAGATWSGYALVAHGDDNAASTVVADSAGNWPGTAAANTNGKSVSGKIGKALTYNGSTDKVDFGNVTQVNGASALSVSMWAYVSTPVAYGMHWGKYDPSGFNGPFWTNLADGDLGGANRADPFIGARDGTNNIQDAYTMSHPESSPGWHLLTYVFDGSQSGTDRLKGYVDGAALTLNYRGTPPASLPTTTAHLTTGAGAGFPLYNGIIDDLQVMASAWSPGLVSTTYHNQNAPGDDGTAGFWSVGPEATTSGASSMTAVSTVIPNGHPGNITLALTGAGTSWSNANTVFTISGVANVTKIGQNVTSATAATLVVTTGAGTGMLAVTETVTGSASTTVAVAVPSFTLDVTHGNLNSAQTLTLTGTNTVWSMEAPAGLFTLSGGDRASIGTPAITANTTGTVQLTVGKLAGPLTITDASTGKTATLGL